jgi:hypothetical protein
VSHISVIPALSKLRQQGHEFEASLGYNVRHCLKREEKKRREEILTHENRW